MRMKNGSGPTTKTAVTSSASTQAARGGGAPTDLSRHANHRSGVGHDPGQHSGIALGRPIEEHQVGQVEELAAPHAEANPAGRQRGDDQERQTPSTAPPGPCPTRCATPEGWSAAACPGCRPCRSSDQERAMSRGRQPLRGHPAKAREQDDQRTRRSETGWPTRTAGQDPPRPPAASASAPGPGRWWSGVVSRQATGLPHTRGGGRSPSAPRQPPEGLASAGLLRADRAREPHAQPHPQPHPEPLQVGDVAPHEEGAKTGSPAAGARLPGTPGPPG